MCHHCIIVIHHCLIITMGAWQQPYHAGVCVCVRVCVRACTNARVCAELNQQVNMSYITRIYFIVMEFILTQFNCIDGHGNEASPCCKMSLWFQVS